MKNIILIVLVFSLFFSCNKTGEYHAKRDLVLVIENSEIFSYDTIGYNKHDSLFFFKLRTNNNVIKYSLENKSNISYFINMSSLIRGTSKKLSISDFKIIDDNGNFVKINIPIVDYVWGIVDSCEVLSDSLDKELYKDLGYKNGLFLNNWISNNIITIHPNEKIFFESLLNLPFNTPYKDKRGPEYVFLNKEKVYKTFMSITIDTTNIKSQLTHSQLKTIKENNYILYHGTLESVNSVPIKFIEL